MSEDAAEKARLLSELAQSLARLTVVVIAGLYAVGLLIVNINLAQYGLVRLDLGRPEYIVAGALWGFFAITTAWCILAVDGKRGLPRVFGLPSSVWRHFISFVSANIVACVLFVSINQRTPFFVSLDLSRIGLAGLSIVVSGLFLDRPMRRLQGNLALPIAERSGGGLWQMIPSVGPHALINFALLTLPSLALYATIAFPELPRGLGGGRQPAVELVLSEMPDLPWSDLGVPVAFERKRVGPVLLLLETDHVMIFTRTQGGQALFSRSEAFGIKNEAIQAIIYKPRLR